MAAKMQYARSPICYVTFENNISATNFISYLKCKFFRALVLSVKISQHAPSKTYRFVPLQDFTRPWTDSVAQQISGVNPPLSNHLVDLKNALFTEIPYQRFYINLVAYGQTVEAVEFVKEQFFVANQAADRSLCHLLHPNIQKVSEKPYRNGSCAEAACNAFIEINSRLKKLYRAKYPDSENVPDGQSLMNKIFADNNPVLEAADRATQTGKDIQSGTRFMVTGAMAALRNPKAHENIEIEKDDSMRRLIFASMLMFQIDEIIANAEGNG